jgi:hypothetical protein
MNIPEEAVSYEDVELQADLTYVEEPSKILAENWKQLCNRAIKYSRCNGNITQKEKLPGKRKKT